MGVQGRIGAMITSAALVTIPSQECVAAHGGIEGRHGIAGPGAGIATPKTTVKRRPVGDLVSGEGWRL